jgi:hypothetical protein
MSLNADQWLEFYKYIASIGAGATAAIMFSKMYFDMQKAKTTLNPQLEQTMVSNIEKDSHSRREFIEAQAKAQEDQKRLQETQVKILDRLVDISIQTSDNHLKGHQKTEELHAYTRKEIAGLGVKLEGELRTIQTNQDKMIELVAPITDRFRKEAA